MIDELRLSHKLNKILKVAGLSKSTYEYYKSSKHINSLHSRALKEDKILSIVVPIFTHHKKRYGVKRVILDAKDDLKGINHKTVERVMSENGLKAIQGNNGKYHSYKGDNGESKENLLLQKETVDGKDKLVRHFETSKPNEIWTTDVSEFKYPGGKLYLSPIFDMYDQSIISYDISTSPDFNQTKRMIDEAFKQYPNLEGLIFHSDQGWQYQHKTYQKWLKDKGIKQSFSRKGNCMDNSPMENFFSIMKNEMYYGYTYNTKEELLIAMNEYITYYNNERINIKRKGLSPLAYRLESFNQLSLA